MKSIQSLIHFTSWRAALLGTTLFAGWSAQAVITQTVNQTGGAAAGWSAAIWGSPADVAAPGNDYLTPDTFAVRTPNNSAPAAFAGDHLQVDSGGILYLKHTLGAANVNLLLNGGKITYHGGPTTDSSPLSGTINVMADSTINSDQGVPNNRDIWLQSDISGSGQLTVAMNVDTNSVIVSGDNSAFTGNWNVTGGCLQIGSGASSPLGSGSVLLNQLNTTLILNATNDLTLTNVISGIGPMTKQNVNTVTLDDNNLSYNGTVEVDAGVLALQSATAIANSYFITMAGGTLDATAIGGLNLNAANYQEMNKCLGTIVSDFTVSSGNIMDFELTPTTNDVLNVTGSLTINGNPTLNLVLAGYKPSGTYRLINYTGTIQGGGSFNLVPPAGSSETFALDTSTPGQVNLIITGVANNLTWVGDGGANYWDIYSPNWTGDASVYADGDSVTFDDSGSETPDVYVYAPVTPSAMTVNNNVAPYVFDNEGISCVGSLTKQGTNELIFTSDNNNFTGPVDIQAGVLSVGNGGASGSLGTPSAITNNGLFRVNLSAGGLALDGPISGTGALDVTGGGATLVLRGTNSYSGLTTIGYECQLNITTSSALGTTDAGTVVLANGRLGVNSYVGSMTVAEPITVYGTGISAAPGALYLNTVNNDLTYSGPITIGSDARFRVVNADARMTFSNTVLGTNVALECTVGNAASDTGTTINFENTLSLGASGSLTKDGQGVVILGSSANTWGSTIISNGTLQVDGVLDGGTVTVNDPGALGGTGTVQGPVSVMDGGIVAPGDNGIGTLTLNNSISLSANAVVLMEINRTNAQNADLLTASSIPLNGVLTVTNIGPDLQVGDTFNLFDGSLSGSFATVNLPDLPSISYKWDTSLLASQGIISVTTNTLPVLPLEVTKIQPQPGSITMTWNTYPGKLYTVEYSLDLKNWSTLATNIAAAAATNVTTAVLDTSGAGAGADVVLAQYQMTGTNAEVQDPLNLVAASGLVPGSGVSLFNVPISLGYPSDPVMQLTALNTGTDLASAVANQAWVTFTLTVGANVTDLDLTSLTFNGARGGGATPRGCGVYVTTPTTTDELVKDATDFATQRPTWDPQSIDLTSFASLQNLTNGQTITFTIPFYAPSPGNSVELDDITVRGNITPAPLPPYAGADKLFLRIKEQ